MKFFFIFTFVANLVLTVISLVILPDNVAIHFGAEGMANGWAPNYINALLMTGVEILMFCSFWFSPRLMLVFPRKWINLPNKDYWLAPENQETTMEKINSFMWSFGVAIFLFFFVLGLLTIQANLGDVQQLNMQVFMPVMGVYLAYTVWWTIGFYRAFRMPKQH